MPTVYAAPGRKGDGEKGPLDAEWLLRGVGASGKLMGFCCAVYMIQRIREDPDQLQLVTKRLYRETARRFGCSPASVERNLRTLIRFCWDRPDHSFWEYVAGTALWEPPTNREFLDMLSSYLRRLAG